MLATISLPLAADVDPAAVVCASRRPGEHWFVFEQPDRGRAALAALGRGDQPAGGRPRALRHGGRALARARGGRCGRPGGRARGRAVPWRWAASRSRPTAAHRRTGRGFEPASLIVPEVALVRSAATGELRVGLTLSALARADDLPEELLARARAAAARAARAARCRCSTRRPTGRFQVVSAMPPEHYEAAVARAVELIGAGELEKIVLAREVQVHAPRAL